MQTADFDYLLPPELIAQTPARERDQSRLLVLNRSSGNLTHEKFRDLLNYLKTGDVLVLNNSAVIPARLRGVNTRTGGRFEILLLEEVAVNDWWVMLRPGKRARVGTEIAIQNHRGESVAEQAVVTAINDEGHRRLRFSATANIREQLDALGETPLPPYITRENTNDLAADKSRYQTVYAQPPGSVAAPTAGLHFTAALLDEIRALGVQVRFVTLHVGLGTFAPVKARALSDHVMHEERFELDDETARVVNEAKRNGRRIIAVGTTTVRVLESVASQNGGRLVSGGGRTRIFIHPPFQFQIVNALLTNFHLPCSTLLMLVSAFAAPGDTRGRELLLAGYAEAVRERYRFFSYGDAMLIL
ncbi:MAG TPA: tRNA preQ1(34) S-adenosylmethionine ribosyltransferase-isomerase QueA [Verrucomicrobiae bacterium]|jgi:S-adenosylmethionine:tRNA ribosyltransferase-isomerase|nr:tRNA preQ1(34) S-adenosylmethionine ribosyltransferase-isomerase QueA [Verrucomicrobiae bacterium]